MFRSWKKKRKRKKARKKIRNAVYAFVYLNNALIHAHISRQVRRQLKHDLMTRDDPQELLLLFLKKVEEAAGNSRDKKTGDLPRSPKGTFKTDGDTITTVSSHME